MYLSGKLPQSTWKYIQLSRTGCWLWQGHIGIHGYGRIPSGNKYSHRVVYEALVGPVQGMLYHKCKRKDCCNPEHMLVGPYHSGQKNSIKTHCPRGHEYSSENTYMTKQGGRQCIACRAVRYQESKLHAK